MKKTLFLILSFLLASVGGADAQMPNGGGNAVPTAVPPSSILIGIGTTPQSVTGTVNETTLATINVPVMGPNDFVEVYTTWAYTNSANTKTLRVRFGGASGTQYLGTTQSTSATTSDYRRIMNAGATNSQVGNYSTSGNPYSASSGAIVTSSVDTTVATTIVISGQLANSGETMTLSNYYAVLTRR